MNKEWSGKNKQIQHLLGSSSFEQGIGELIALRAELFAQITQTVKTFPCEAFSQMPYANADGYHSKTLAYSIWHIFRIEDITVHELIARDTQILFTGGHLSAIGADRITTGNELRGEEIAAFSAKLDIDALYRYAEAVRLSTDGILRGLSRSDLKRTFSQEERENLRTSGYVSDDSDAAWLVDYWCDKNVLGLIKMPLSRHWIMHIEAMQRIQDKLYRLARKSADPVAYCGFSCNHCFLEDRCGSCRTAYNTCSYAAIEPDGQCPNAKCCREKDIDGCYECNELLTCQKGFYTEANDGSAAAKAQALYILKHGKKAFLSMRGRMQDRYTFSKTQEILGQDVNEGLRILEEI